MILRRQLRASRRYVMRSLTLAIITACLACDPGPDTDPGQSSTTGPIETGTIGHTSALDGDSDGAALDVPPPSPSPSCGPLDFLFVVDTSASLSTEISNLNDLAPLFVAGITGDEHRVMVVDVDRWDGRDCDMEACGTQPGGCSPDGLNCEPGTEGGLCSALCDPCWGYDGMSCPDPQPMACPDLPGTGKTHGCWDGPWVPTTHPSSVACVLSSVTADAWTQERQGDAIVGALADPAGCNDDFARLDATLVLVLVTDEPDGSMTGPDDWTNAVADRYGENVVAVGLLPEDCVGAAPAPTLTDWVLSWERSIVRPVCGDYVTALGEAAALVQQDCSVG